MTVTAASTEEDEDVAMYRGVISIEWPPPSSPGPYGAMAGCLLVITDMVTGKQIRTATSTDVTVHADAAQLVTADLTLFTDADGEPVVDGEPVLLDAERGEFRTAVFPFLVGEMKVRGA